MVGGRCKDDATNDLLTRLQLLRDLMRPFDACAPVYASHRWDATLNDDCASRAVPQHMEASPSHTGTGVLNTTAS
jgi:hypothetical protein